MRRAAQRAYHLVTTLVKTRRLTVERRRIRKTWFRVFFLKQYDSEHKTAEIVGFRVRFCDPSTLERLFADLFLANEYHFVADGDTPCIVDCGSNIGMSVLYFKMLYPQARILAFEPGEETYACLEENVRNNRLTSVVLHKAALSNHEGSTDFYYDRDDVGSLRMSTKHERMPKHRRTVRAERLSKHIDADVDLLKLDVEGSELEILEELRQAGKLRHCKQMVIEYHHHIETRADAFSEFLRILEDAGFGYQIEGRLERPLVREVFQDVLVYAYRKT